MTEPGMDSDDWREWDRIRQNRHAQWRKRNMQAIERCVFKYKIVSGGEAVLFRSKGKPKVDFYPSTGRWRVVGYKSTTYSGGATKFLSWYAGVSE